MKLPIEKDDDTGKYSDVSFAYAIVGAIEVIIGLGFFLVPALNEISYGYPIYGVWIASGVASLIIGGMSMYASAIIDRARKDVEELRDYIKRLK